MIYFRKKLVEHIMKLKFDMHDKKQPDPFIFEDGGKFYILATGYEGVEAYSTSDIFGTWKYEGIVTEFTEGSYDFWAPSVIKYEGKYYIYVSCRGKDDPEECMRVAVSDSPLGPFKNEKRLYDKFSIDSHAVTTEAGLFLWLSMNDWYFDDTHRAGTRIFVVKMKDPYTPDCEPVEKVIPTLDEEKFTPQCNEKIQWHTIEGAFWFKEGDYQYLMYSGGCYQDDTYHIGYCYAKSDEPDLRKVEFIKHTDGDKFAPTIIGNSFEEGTGHHSVLKLNGKYYAIYHGRDVGVYDKNAEYVEERTARICALQVSDGKIIAHQYSDKI